MSFANKFARLMRNTGPARFFVPFGVILIIAGIILSGIKTDNYVETSGTIMSVAEAPRGADEDQQYDLTVRYTADGKEYEAQYTLSGKFSVGDPFKLYYDPADPQRTTNSKMDFLGPVMIVLGALAILFGVYKTVTAFKKSKALDQEAGTFPADAFEGIKTAPGVTEYYVRFDGHGLKPGYIVEDADRNVLYEGAMTKQALVGARTFEFRDHTTGAVQIHEVGHTVTQTYNDGFFTAKSWFKFDGKNVWDAVHDRGVRISTNLLSKFPHMVYDIAQNGAPLARVETSGIYVHEDEAAQHAVNVPTGWMYYRFWTASKDFETIFLTIFAISETEQAVVE